MGRKALRQSCCHDGLHRAARDQRSDGRLVLRDTAQTSVEDMAASPDLDRHRFCNSNKPLDGFGTCGGAGWTPKTVWWVCR